MESSDPGCGTSGKKKLKDPNDVYAESIKSIITGVGFLIVAFALLFTGVAGGRSWWWAMLFPAFTFLAKGVSEYMKYGKMQKSRVQFGGQAYGNMLDQPVRTSALPPQRTQFVTPSPESRYKTGDLVPPSVTEGTTKLLELELDSEGQTRALPKK